MTMQPGSVTLRILLEGRASGVFVAEGVADSVESTSTIVFTLAVAISVTITTNIAATTTSSTTCEMFMHAATTRLPHFKRPRVEQ